MYVLVFARALRSLRYVLMYPQRNVAAVGSEDLAYMRDNAFDHKL